MKTNNHQLGADATIILFADKKQKRSSTYFRGDNESVIALLAAAALADPKFGACLSLAALAAAEEFELRKKKGGRHA
jgi:hypothetical protein